MTNKKLKHYDMENSIILKEFEFSQYTTYVLNFIMFCKQKNVGSITYHAYLKNRALSYFSNPIYLN